MNTTEKAVDEMFRKMRLTQRNLMRQYSFPFNMMAEVIDDDGRIKEFPKTKRPKEGAE